MRKIKILNQRTVSTGPEVKVLESEITNGFLGSKLKKLIKIFPSEQSSEELILCPYCNGSKCYYCGGTGTIPGLYNTDIIGIKKFFTMKIAELITDLPGINGDRSLTSENQDQYKVITDLMVELEALTPIKRKKVKRKAKKRGGKRNQRNGLTTYVFSSMFLVETWQYLTSFGEDEALCYVTGIDKGNVKYPYLMQKPRMAEQSPGFVRGDRWATRDMLEYYDDFDHPVLCLFHRHPGNYTSPSEIDRGTHEAMESIYPVIGAIFTKPGFIRFFAYTKDFNIEIFGEGVIKVDGEDNLYQIIHD